MLFKGTECLHYQLLQGDIDAFFADFLSGI